MDWDFMLRAPIPPQSQLLHGCFLEAERADRVSAGVDGLRAVLPEKFHGHMLAVIEEIRNSSRLLRDLADRSNVHMSRAQIVASHLNIILPCLSKTLRDITGYYEDKTVTRELRWRKMYHEMADEAGIPLPQRFMMYNHFLMMLLYFLTNDKNNFDQGQLEILRLRLLELRERRGIPPPKQLPVTTMVQQQTMMVSITREPDTHWAERVFSLPLISRTELKPKQNEKSRAYGPFYPPGDRMLPDASKILMKRSFDNDRLSLMLIMNSADRCPYLVLRVYGPGSMQLFSVRGVHELCAYRRGSAIFLRRWSQSSNASKLWALLSFVTWEELVLFYCAFVALKARNTLTIKISPKQFDLENEARLFQASIIDDGYQHSLIVYQDTKTNGLRLHAAVYEGELTQCPVWTAFVTYQSASPSWLVRKTKHRIWLKEIQLYVFCDKYKEENMRRNKAGAFELSFVSSVAADRFKQLFIERANPGITPEPSEAIAGPSY